MGKDTNGRNRRVRKKLQSRSGLSMLFALSFLLLCSVLGALGLGIARLHAERNRIEYQKEQEMQALTLASRTVREKLLLCEGQWELEDLEELEGCTAEILKCFARFAQSSGTEAKHLYMAMEVDDSGDSMPAVQFELMVRRNPDEDISDPDISDADASDVGTSDQDESAETEDIIWIPFSLNGDFYIENDAGLVRRMKLYSQGEISYDRENQWLDVTLEQVIFKEK